MVEPIKNEAPEGLGGWLILVGAGLILNAFTISIVTILSTGEVFKNDTWQVIRTLGTDAHHPFLVVLFLGETVLDLGMAVAGLYLIYLFFRKKRSFPRVYIYFSVFSLLYLLIDLALVKIVAPNIFVLTPEYIREVTRLFVAVAIWGPYMLVSKRVKATFVK